MRFVSTKIYQV